MARGVSLRARGKARAMTLAEEQGEERALKIALQLVEKCDRQIQKRENAKAIRKLLGNKEDSTRKKKGRNPQHLQHNKLKLISCTKKKREDLKELIALLLHLFQRSLKRCHLRKGSMASASARLSRSEFIDLFGGYLEIMEHDNKKLFALISASNTAEANMVLGPLLNITDKKDKSWYCRRYYGEDISEPRDCSYIKVDGSHSARNMLIFEWRQEKTAHLDRQGRLRQTSMGKLRIRFPRGTASVNPAKAFRK